MITPVSQTRKTEQGAEVLPSEAITLVSWPKSADDAAVVVRTPALFQDAFTLPSPQRPETSFLDLPRVQSASRPFSPLSTPPKPLSVMPANAGGGGSFRGGASTPNAGLGGGTPTGGGGGPGLVNANQFVGVDFGAAQGTLAHSMPSAPPASPTPSFPPPSAAVSEPPSSPAVVMSYSLTPPSLLGLDSSSLSPSVSLSHAHGYGHDPLYVLDLNTGETIPANVTLHTFASGPSMNNWTENLLAQVSGGAVASYSWDLSQAPDAVNVSGANTAHLQFTWASFTGPAHTDTISVTETPQSGQPLTQTITFAVAGYNSPAYSNTPPTSSSTWPTVITPDQISIGQATQAAGPYARLGLADGSVQTSFALPSYNPNVAPLSLDYNSTTANAQPIFLAEYQLPFGQSVPSTITAQLTFNNTPLATVTYDTSGLNPGDIVQIALQADATGVSTGRYPWSITVTDSGTPTTFSGSVDIVNQANSPYGAGWSLDNVEQLVPVSGGVMLVEPGGTSLYFASNGSGGFTTPAGDFSTLVQNSDGSYTRTLPDGTQIHFNSSGQQTSLVDRDGNTTTFAYNSSGQLTSITDMNGQVTTLTYNSSGLLASITDPANRTATLSYTGRQLTRITDPAGDVWQYAYDAANDLTALTDPNGHTTTFTYNFADRVSSVTFADNTTEQLTAVQMNGLAAPGTGTPGNPAPSVLLGAGDQALFTDGNGNAWIYGLDWLGFGHEVAAIDPLGDASLNYIDTNGLVWMTSDGLGRPTVDFFDNKGNIIEEVAPDNTIQQYQYNAFSEVTQYTDQKGNITQYAYNSKGDLTQVTDALGDITTYAYNNAGLVTSTTDPNGNVTTNTYNNLNERTSTTNALGGVYTYTYNNAGQMISSTDPLGNTSTYAYDAMNRLIGKTLPDTPGVYSTYTYTYDKVGNQLTSTDPNGHTTTNTYNAFNKLVSTTNPLGDTTTYGYDNVGNLTSVTNPLSQTTTYAYNAANEQISATDALGNTTVYGYDAAGELTNVTDPMGNQTVYSYTPRGQLQAVQNLDSSGNLMSMVIYNYGPCGCLQSITVVDVAATQENSNINGSITGYNYDSYSYGGNYYTNGSAPVSGNISGTVSDNNVYISIDAYILFPSGAMFPIYGSFSGVINDGMFGGTFSGTAEGVPYTGTVSGSVKNGILMGTLSASYISLPYAPAAGTFSGTFSNIIGKTTIYQRNAGDQVTSVTDPNGNMTSYNYDADGNVISVTDANGNTTNYTYNPFNEVTSVTNNLGIVTNYNYNNAGELTKILLPGSDPTYSYDGQGRLLTVTDDLGGGTSYAYDLAGNLLSVTDPDGNVTKYSYDAANELVSTTNPMGHQSTYVYNAAGEMTSTTDADGRTIDYAYDADGHVISETWIGANYTANYQYNADGELTSASDPNSVYTYTYDGLGDVTSVSNAGTPGVPTVTLSYAYDSFGNRTSLADSLGGSISYAYDADNAMTGLSLSSNSALDAQLTMSYDGDGNLTGLTRTAPSVNGDTITTSYSYNTINELTNITDTDTTKSLTLANYTYTYDAVGNVSSYQDNSGNSLNYGYDGNQELTSATGMLNGSNYRVNYSYDANGNRTMPGYQTGTGNELLSDGTYNYTYDADGNMTSQTNIATGYVTYYTWDYRNRLVEVKQEDNHNNVLNDEKFTYDVFNNRIAVSLNGTPQLYTVYDGANPYLDFNGSGQLTERYLYNPNALSQFYGQVNANGNAQWFLTDNLGSIRQVVDTSGNVLDAITYDPYGNIVSQTNAANAPRFLYAGGAYDPLTNYDQFGRRYYDPADGRWTSQDPLGFVAQDTNLFRYVFNSPAVYADPSGEFIFIILGIAVVLAAGANTETGANFIVNVGDSVTGGGFSGWAAGPSNDWYGRFGNRVDRWSFGNQVHNGVDSVTVLCATRLPKGIQMPGYPSTTSIWTKVPFWSLKTGQRLGYFFSGIVLVEGGYNIIMIPTAAVYTTWFDGEE